MSDTPQELPQDLPEGASKRLAELEQGLFTSDLSVNEFLLIKEVGFHPVGFVMGSSIYHTGIQTRRWSQSQELTKLTEAMYNARELAMTRMEEEALELGADGVVGVRLDVNYYEWGKDAAEFIAVGTAVKAESGVSHRNALGKPFTSDLSGQDFWTPGTSPRAWSWAPASTTSPTAGSGPPWAPPARTSSCPTSPRRSTRPGSWP